MSRFMLAIALTVMAAPALAQAPINLLPPPAREAPAPAMSAPITDKPPVDEPEPTFEPIRPIAPEAAPEPAPQPVPVPQVAPAPSPEPPPPSVAAPAPIPEPAAAPAPMVAPAASDALTLPVWASALLILLGAFTAGLFGILFAGAQRRAEWRSRRRAVAATLATELETRRLAFESVPLPPNAEAGVSFVSSVTSLAGIDCGFRSSQFDVHLLPEKLASHVSVHYAAVQRVADFVKGQSMAAAVRMLQANRLGGHPCPDAGAMREAHVEMAAAFRGIDKLIGALRGLS